MRTQIIAGIVAGATALVISAPQAHADAELEILVGGVPVAGTPITEVGPTGSISADYTYAGITVDVSALWDGNSMDLDNIDVNGASHVQIILSDDDNAPPGGVADLGVSGHDFGSGTLNGNVKAYWSASNVLLAQTTLVTSQSTLIGDQDKFGLIDATHDFSMTEVVSITSGSGNLSSDDSVTVPDGGLTVAMLGGAMSVLALARFKANKLS